MRERHGLSQSIHKAVCTDVWTFSVSTNAHMWSKLLQPWHRLPEAVASDKTHVQKECTNQQMRTKEVNRRQKPRNQCETIPAIKRIHLLYSRCVFRAAHASGILRTLHEPLHGRRKLKGSELESGYLYPYSVWRPSSVDRSV